MHIQLDASYCHADASGPKLRGHVILTLVQRAGRFCFLYALEQVHQEPELLEHAWAV